MRIAIFGGSFNPIHNGHINIINEVLRQDLADNIWLMPTDNNPLKPASNFLSHKTKIGLIESSIRSNDFKDKIKVIESQFNYAYLELERLITSYPDDSFTLIIGADNWLCFNEWKNYKYILDNSNIIIYSRPGYDIDINALPNNITYLDINSVDISSTQIRNAFNLLCNNIPINSLHEYALFLEKIATGEQLINSPL